MKPIDELFRASRAARLAARKEHARAKSGRAAIRAQHLLTRAIVETSRQLCARLAAEKAIAVAREAARLEVTAPTTPGSPAAR